MEMSGQLHVPAALPRRRSLEAVEQRKISFLCRQSKFGCPARRPSITLTNSPQLFLRKERHLRINMKNRILRSNLQNEIIHSILSKNKKTNFFILSLEKYRIGLYSCLYGMPLTFSFSKKRKKGITCDN
jgi:hypothetical protein